MTESATNRVWASLTDAEAAAVAEAAAARGIRPSDLTRLALLAFLERPVPPPAERAAAGMAPVLARLDTIADVLGRLVSATDEVAAERDEVRGTLSDIAQAIGVMAGSLAPEDDVEAAFGPDRD
jgi:hypothetical protein